MGQHAQQQILSPGYNALFPNLLYVLARTIPQDIIFAVRKHFRVNVNYVERLRGSSNGSDPSDEGAGAIKASDVTSVGLQCLELAWIIAYVS